MKKLNKKGFTLIELLAVIVVLAIVLVVTIPAVITSLGDSKEQAFKASANSIASWFEAQAGYCKLGTSGVPNGAYDKTLLNSLFGTTCTANVTSLGTDADKILKAAGGSVDDYKVTKLTVDANGRACVELSVEGKDNSKFKGLTSNTASSTGC